MSKKFWSFKKTPSPAIKVDKSELKKRLTPVQYRVTQEAATERPFSGEYLKLKDNGMYACVVCGEELFSSACKYESGCGWPAFYDAEDENKLIYKADLSHVGGNIILLALKPDLVRTEVTCGNCGAHLGHVFDDGPKPTGKRYCINSASLKFNRVSSSSSSDSDSTQPKEEGRVDETGEKTSGQREAETREKDAINNPAEAVKSNSRSIGVTVPSKKVARTTVAGKVDQSAVRQSNSKPDPPIRAQDTLSSSTDSPLSAPVSNDSGRRQGVEAESNLELEKARRLSSGILSQRMRFFTSQRDAHKYNADRSKLRSVSVDRRTALTSRGVRTENSDSLAVVTAASPHVRKTDGSGPKTTSPALPPSTVSSSKSSALRSSWFASSTSPSSSATAAPASQAAPVS